MPYWHYQLVLSLYFHQPGSHQLSLHKVLESVSQFETTGPIDRTPGTPGSDKHDAKLRDGSGCHVLILALVPIIGIGRVSSIGIGNGAKYWYR